MMRADTDRASQQAAGYRIETKEMSEQMPTGYTAGVGDGKVTDLAAFTLQCARAFGALIEMRDDAMDAPIPDSFQPSSYHVNALAKAKAERVRLGAMTIPEAERASVKAYEIAKQEWTDSAKRRQETLSRYELMLSKVRAWQPPSSEHLGLKTFMIEQLTESICFDCADDSEWKPKRKTGAQWLAEAIERAERDVSYHEQYLADDIKRAADRTRWVRELRESLAHDRERATR